MRDMLLVLGYDASVARAAARKLRAERICCRILPGDADSGSILREDPGGVILCAAQDTPLQEIDQTIMTLPVPVLALGAAAACMAAQMGGSRGVFSPDRRMTPVRFCASPLFDGIVSTERMVSGMIPMTLPADTAAIAAAEDSGLPFAFACGGRKRFGTLMELEPHDPDASLLLANFALKVCGCTAWWDEDAFVSQAVGDIRLSAGGGTALCLMTGGLHASVTALLGARALREKLRCVFINTGLLQDGEDTEFARFFAERIGLQVEFRDERSRFLQALKGLRRQDEKRRAIHSMMQVINREIQRQIPDLSLIIQDRVYADAPQEDGLSARAGVATLEPLKDLFLDEVRQVGSYLGLSHDMIAGQLVPDTGLALNIVGEVTDEKLSILRYADSVFRRNIRQSGLSKKLSEYYAVLRPYEKDTYSVILRALALNTGDQFRAARVSFDVLEESAETIRRDCASVLRVLYDLTPTSRQ